MPDCENCWHYDYDEETDTYCCNQDIDEDEWYRICMYNKGICPFFRQGDDYYLARHQ